MMAVGVSELVVAAFQIARQRQSSTVRRWTGFSHMIGGRLPDSLLAMSIQRIGELDALLRCMEEETRAILEQTKDGSADGSRVHLQIMFSAEWICNLYEIYRLVQDRQLVQGDDAFDSLANDLRALRVTLSKHEIAADRKLPRPVLMRRGDGTIEDDINEYVPGDPKRTHIMPTGLSVRGSARWQAVDGTPQGRPRWLERLSLSERALELVPACLN